MWLFAVVIFVIAGAFIGSRLLHVLVGVALPGGLNPQLPPERLSPEYAVRALKETTRGTVTTREDPDTAGVAYSEQVMDGTLEISFERLRPEGGAPREITTFRFRAGEGWVGKPSVATMKYLAPAYVDIDHLGLEVRVAAWIEHPIFLRWFRGMVLRMIAELGAPIEEVVRPAAPAPCPMVLDGPVPWDATCQVCGTGLAVEHAVRCPACHTPHHQTCWEYAGGCTVYGCTVQTR